MASKINADEFVDREGEGKPTLPKGVVLSGVTTITTAVVDGNEVANSTGINVGIITSTHFAGNLTGDVNAGIVTVTSQTVVGSAVTISASGIDIGAGVITATSYAGSGANLTGLGATIMVWEYNPDPYDTAVTFDTGIGITFNQKIKAGSGNITLRETNASGTVVENFGIGSSVTISNNSLSLTPTSSLSESQVYYLELPSGVITNMAGDNYVGTAYTFKALGYNRKLFVWGMNSTDAMLGQNNTVPGYSSPIQVPGITWRTIAGSNTHSFNATKTDGTLWTWGEAAAGQLGQNTLVTISSPIQIGSGTDWSENHYSTETNTQGAVKTDGTLWMWGKNDYGELGQNSTNSPANSGLSSPVQIPGTTWSTTAGALDGGHMIACVKTDGTAWAWGRNDYGELGHNNRTHYSSPVQIPGTTWKQFSAGNYNSAGVKTDGTMWTWGLGNTGRLGHNQEGVTVSSPTQIPGTTWKQVSNASTSMMAVKTDGTLWGWGNNQEGRLGLNDEVRYSSPTQVPGTTWTYVGTNNEKGTIASKTDGTLWAWGSATYGQTGQNNTSIKYSSPVQIPGTDWGTALSQFGVGVRHFAAIQTAPS